MNTLDLYRYRGNPSEDTLLECLRIYEGLGQLDLRDKETIKLLEELIENGVPAVRKQLAEKYV